MYCLFVVNCCAVGYVLVVECSGSIGASLRDHPTLVISHRCNIIIIIIIIITPPSQDAITSCAAQSHLLNFSISTLIFTVQYNDTHQKQQQFNRLH